MLTVLFVFSHLGVSLAGIGILYLERMPGRTLVDNQKTTIVCNAGNKGQYIAAAEGIYFGIADIEAEYLPDHLRARLRELCAVTQQEVQARLKALFDGPPSERTSTSGNLFDIKPTYITEGGAWDFAKGAVLWLVGVSTAFEIVRRTFFYIALGTILPAG